MIPKWWCAKRSTYSRGMKMEGPWPAEKGFLIVGRMQWFLFICQKNEKCKKFKKWARHRSCCVRQSICFVKLQNTDETLYQNNATCNEWSLFVSSLWMANTISYSKILLTEHPRPRITGWLLVKLQRVEGWVYFKSKRVTLCKSGFAERSLILPSTNFCITQLN